MKIELQTGGRSSGKTLLTIKQNYHFNEVIKEEDLMNTNPFIQHLTTKYIKELNKCSLKKTLDNKFIEKIKHQQKVIDRLSRKIQKQKKIISIISNSNYILEHKYRFLMHRENKLQQIEQMFKSGTVDLKELTELVNENL